MSDELDPILAAVDRLAPALEASGLDELDLTVGDLEIRLSRPVAVAAAPASTAGRLRRQRPHRPRHTRRRSTA